MQLPSGLPSTPRHPVLMLCSNAAPGVLTCAAAQTAGGRCTPWACWAGTAGGQQQRQRLGQQLGTLVSCHACSEPLALHTTCLPKRRLPGAPQHCSFSDHHPQKRTFENTFFRPMSRRPLSMAPSFVMYRAVSSPARSLSMCRDSRFM